MDLDLNLKKMLTYNLWDVLKNHKIDANFAVKYILFSRYKKTESEKCINRDDILFFQPHISANELNVAISLFYENEPNHKISI